MAVVSVDLIEVSQPSANRSGERSIVEVYRVVVDDVVNDSIYTARDATGIPPVNSQWAYGTNFDNGVYASDYSTVLEDRKGSHLIYLVTVTYETLSRDQEDESQNDDPLLKPPVISGSGVRFSKLVPEKDQLDVEIKNAAGDAWPDLEMDDSRPTLIIEKNFATIDLAQYADFSNAVNSATFWGLDRYKWKLSFPRWRQLYRGNQKYYNVIFEFEGMTDTKGAFQDWKHRPVQRGHFRLDIAPGGKRVKVVDGNNLTTNIPQFLNADGTQKQQAQPVVAAGPFEVYKVRDFGLLNIPITGP